MPRSRRDVKFAHRGGGSNSSSSNRPRRASQALSDLTDDDTESERESPSSRNGGLTKHEVGVRAFYVRAFFQTSIPRPSCVG